MPTTLLVAEWFKECALIEQCLTSPPTQYRLFGRRFYRSTDPTNSIKVLKEHSGMCNLAAFIYRTSWNIWHMKKCSKTSG